MPRAFRIAAFFVSAAILFATALSGEVYNATSPPVFGPHVFLRKTYSVLAFAVVGALYALARRHRPRWQDVTCAIGLYSGAIEIAQWFVASESLAWNLLDVLCGIAGGAAAAALLATRRFAGHAR